MFVVYLDRLTKVATLKRPTVRTLNINKKINMDTKKLKDQFLSGLPKELTDKLTPPFLALIEETVESVIDGSTTIDGKKALTDEEAINLINHGILARLKVFQETIAGAKKLDADSVTINYRGTTLKVK